MDNVEMLRLIEKARKNGKSPIVLMSEEDMKSLGIFKPLADDEIVNGYKGIFTKLKGSPVYFTNEDTRVMVDVE